MAGVQIPSYESLLPGKAGSAEERLEGGEVLVYIAAPFPLPQSDDRAFLLQQQLGGLGRKHITCNPGTGETSGFVWRSAEQAAPAQRAGRLLAGGHRLAGRRPAALPQRLRTGSHQLSPRGRSDAAGATERPQRPLARRCIPESPGADRRILRVFANLNPTEPRVWATSEPLGRLVSRYRERIERAGFLRQLGSGFRDLLRPRHERRSETDVFMLRLHNYLKRNVKFQQTGSRRLWKFPPGSVWLAMTDGCCYADLRGRFALEQSFFIAPHVLVRPDLAPAALIRSA